MGAPHKTTQVPDVRRVALQLLHDWEEKDGFINLMLSDAVLASVGTQAGFLTALVYGTVERKLTLDYFIGALAGREVSALDGRVRNILRLGLYQLCFLSVSPHAAVHQTVALSDNRGQKALINFVLREACRRMQGEGLPYPSDKNTARRLSVLYSFPLSTVKRFLTLFGKEETERLLAFYNRVAPLSLFVDPSFCQRDDYIKRLQEQGLVAEPMVHAPYGIRVMGGVSPTALPGFAQGACFVQDEASQIAVCALSPEQNHRIIDVCACPGGKTFGAALHINKTGEFYAFDLHESKLSLIRNSAERLGLTVHTDACDAVQGQAELFGTADRVICDVPCSGLGVLGKKPDLRYREVTGELPPLQAAITDTAYRYLKKGGVMVYSTCTLLPEENQENVCAFLARHPDMQAEDFSVGALQSHDGMLTLLPHIHSTDGFFMARLRKT